MIVPMVPFFLAVQLATNDSSRWVVPFMRHQFRAEIEVSATLDEKNETQVVIDKQAVLTCRKDGEIGLACYFDKDLDDENELTERADLDEVLKAFRMEFDATGVKNLYVPPQTTRHELDILRRLVAQFSVGIDLSPLREFPHEVEVDSPSGRCKTFVNVSRYAPDVSLDTGERRGDTIKVLPMSDWTDNMLLLTEKIKTADECPAVVQRFGYLLTRAELLSSSHVSGMVIKGRGEFKSYTLAETVVSNEQTNETATIRETRTVEYIGFKMVNEVWSSMKDHVKVSADEFAEPTLD